MASRYEISAVFRMIDNLTAPVQRMSNSTMTASKRMQMEMEKTKMKIKAVGQAMATAGKLALAAGVALAGKTVVDSIKTYIEFEDAVTKAGSKFKDLDVTSADYQNNLEQLQTAAREVGAATMFSATDAAGALDKMAMAGLTSKQSMGMLMGTTNLAVAAGIDLTSAVDMATDAMGAFNLMTDEAGNPLDEKGIADSMNRVADVVAKTTNMANLDMNMWFETVKMGAPTFTSLGGTLEEFSAAAGTLANAGIKGSIAGNALKTMMLRLSAPASSGAEALKKLGISVFDANGQMRPFLDIMEQFEKNLDGMADEEKASLLKDIFGTETIGSFNVLMASGTENLKEFTKTLENAGGTAEAIANAQMNSFSGMIEQLKSAWQDKQLSIGKAFETGGAKEALQGLIAYVQNLDISAIVKFLASLMTALPKIVSGIGSVISFIWELKEVILIVAGAVGIFKIAIVAYTVAQWAMNSALLACPLTWIILAIIALIAAIVLLVKNWDTVKDALSRLWDYVVDSFNKAIDYIVSSFNAVIDYIVSSFNAAIDTIASFFSWLWEKITWLGSVIGDFFVGIWDSFIEWNAMCVEKVTGFFSWLWGKITWLGSVIGDFFVGIWDSFIEWNAMCVEKVTGFFSWLWEKISGLGSTIGDFFVGIWDGIVNFFTTAIDYIASFFSWIWEKMVGIGESISSVFSSVWGGIKGFFSGMIDGVKNVGKSILSFLLTPVIKALDLMSGIPGIGDWIGGKRDALIAFQNSLTDTIVEANTPQTNQLGADFDYYKSLGWDTEDDGLPPTVSPITQGERTAYSVTESNNNTSTEVTVTLDKGLQGSVSRPAPNVTVKNTRSGSW